MKKKTQKILKIIFHSQITVAGATILAGALILATIYGSWALKIYIAKLIWK
jgi:hypothetical protein